VNHHTCSFALDQEEQVPAENAGMQNAANKSVWKKQHSAASIVTCDVHLIQSNKHLTVKLKVVNALQNIQLWLDHHTTDRM